MRDGDVATNALIPVLVTGIQLPHVRVAKGLFQPKDLG